MTKEYDPGDYNKSGMMAFLFCMVVTCTFFVYIAFVHKGVDLKEIPQMEAEKAIETGAPNPEGEKAQE